MKTIQLIDLSTAINSSFLRGPAKAPAIKREVLYSDRMSRVSESSAELEREYLFEDVGILSHNGAGEQKLEGDTLKRNRAAPSC